MSSTTPLVDAKVWKPLQGVRVADFSVLFPGPFATTLLADLGADVVKIEPPGGDPARVLLPELFASTARNKRSVVLDLKSSADREEAAEIAAWADIAIEGFRPGVADRLGIGYERLKVANPRLIYCSLSGYGQDGPWKDRPGHDLNYLAAGGALAYSAMYGRQPGRSSVPLGDISGGALAASALLAALRERDQTGASVYLDLSVFEATLYAATLRHGTVESEGAGLFPGNDIFQTRDDRHVTLALVEDHFWHAFRELLGHEEPALRDPRFDTILARKRHAKELAPLLERLIKSRTAQQWADLLAGSDMPFEICVSPAEAVRSEHVLARGRVACLGGQSYVPFPVTVDGRARPSLRNAAPGIGEHTESFLRELRERRACQTSHRQPPPAH